MSYNGVKTWIDGFAPKNKSFRKYERAHDEKEIDRKLIKVSPSNIDYEVYYEERVVAVQIRKGKKKLPY